MTIWSNLSTILAQEAGLAGSYWMPPQASSFASGVDNVFYFIGITCLIFFVLVTVLLIWFPLRYRAKTKGAATDQHSHSTTLELTWTTIPTILVVLFFYFGFTNFMEMTTPPQNVERIHVKGYQWYWEFTYLDQGGVKLTNKEGLYIPKDKAVELVLESNDVIHSFFIPAFRTKRDVVPGRVGKMWFKAIEMAPEGHDGFDFFCTEYCGLAHSQMGGKVYVLPVGEYEETLRRLGSKSYTAAVAFENNTAQLFKLQQQSVNPGAGLAGHTAAVTDIALSSDGKWVLTAASDGAKVWSKSFTPDSAIEPTNLAVEGAANTVTFAPGTAPLLAVTGAGNSIAVWELTPNADSTAATAKQSGSIDAGATVNTVSFSGDGKWLLAGTNNGASVFSVAAANGAVTLTKAAGFAAGNVVSVAFDGNASHALLAAGNDATLWSLAAQENTLAATQLGTLQGHTGAVTYAGFSSTSAGNFAVTGSADGTVKMWALDFNAQTVVAGAPSSFAAHSGGVVDAAISADGGLLLTAGADTRVRFWKFDFAAGVTATRLSEFTGHLSPGVRAVAIGPGEDPVEKGKATYTQLCAVCHDPAIVCPSLVGIWGQTHQFSNADPTVVDDGYLRESMLEPGVKLREGFANAMPSFAGQLDDDTIFNLIEYIKSLKQPQGQ